MAIDTQAQASKRTRTSSSKVRTGCVTCKIRHVKCDEEKPFCRRCTGTGRKCDGYESPKPSKASMRNTVVIYVPPQKLQRKILPLPGHSEVDHYHRYVAPRLSSSFDSPFWTTLILQMSQSEPAIRHAVSAITATYKDVENLPSPTPGRPIIANPAAMKETGQAFRSLTTRMQADPGSSLVPLVACLLFTCLECMRGCVDGAMTHMMSGFNILNDVRSRSARDGSRRNMNQSDLDLIEEQIAPFFARLNLLCITFGRPTPSRPTEYNMDSKFETLTEARRKLYELAHFVLSFVRAGTKKAEIGAVDVADLIERTKLERQCEHWHSKMEEYIASHCSTFTPDQQIAVDLCRIHALTISIWLTVSLDADELALDGHTEEFETILRLCGNVVSAYEQANKAGEGSQFSFEMGVIPPLYYTAIKCRTGHIRRQAIALLRRGPRREGLWNAHIAIKVAEAVIALEEGGIRAANGLPGATSRVRGVGPQGGQLPVRVVKGGHRLDPLMTLKTQDDLPLETYHCRIRETTIPESDENSKIEVVFRAKPWGSDGKWAIWKQEVEI